MRYPKRKASYLRREKIAFLSLAAFVLTVLTLAGVYVREKNKMSDEYRIDLAGLDNNEIKKMAESAKKNTGSSENSSDIKLIGEVLSNDLDVDPNYWEVDSTDIIAKLPGAGATTPSKSDKNEKKNETKEVVLKKEEPAAPADPPADNSPADPEAAEASTSALVQYTFANDRVLNVPVAGAVLIPFSMDKPVYYKTLNQYKYSDAVVVSASVGESVATPATGVVKSVFKSVELGKGITLDIGNGYELTFGQLKDVVVREGDIVNKGDILGSVAEPTSFYTVEGSNIYMKLTHDGEIVDPTAEID